MQTFQALRRAHPGAKRLVIPPAALHALGGPAIAASVAVVEHPEHDGAGDRRGDSQASTKEVTR